MSVRLCRFDRMAAAAFVTAATLSSACSMFPSSGDHNWLEAKGYVMSSADSVPVPGAEITVTGVESSWEAGVEYTDENGYFESVWTPLTEDDAGDVRHWVLTVHDVDGELNGVFADLDTILVEEDPVHITETRFELNLYVVME